MYGPWAGKGLPSQFSLADIMIEVRGVNTNVDQKFNLLQVQIGKLQEELSDLKAEMVTKSDFENLEKRVIKLESGSRSPEMNQLYIQLNRLDPAHKALAIGGFGETDLQKRVDYLNKILQESVGCPSDVTYDHIHKGKKRLAS